MVKVRKNITIDSGIIEKAQEKGINLSHAAEQAVKEKLNIKEVEIREVLKCEYCGKPGEKETADDVKESVRLAAESNDHHNPLRYSNPNMLTWIYPAERWICNSCLSNQLSRLPVSQ